MSGKKILAGMRQAVAYANGEKVNVFAEKFGFSSGSVRNWEQGHRRPDGAARVLLAVIKDNPDAVLKALSHVEQDYPRPDAHA